MIKFFRKIRQNLLKENKTTKYFKYAIGEIILVIIGILIALQRNNWNENRVAQSRIDSRLMNLISDLEADIMEMEEIAQLSMKRVVIIKEILTQTNRTGSLNLTSLEIPKYEVGIKSNPNSDLSYLKTLDGNVSAYNELINSGEFYLIKNSLIANQIQNYYATVKEVKDAERWNNQETWLTIAKSKQRLGLGTYSIEGTLDKLIDLAKNDQQFGAELEHEFVLDLTQYNLITNLTQKAKSLIEALKSRNGNH